MMTKLRQDFEIMETELEQVEAQVCTKQDCVEILRLQIDEGLDEALKGLEDLTAKLPKEQNIALFEQCTNNALDAVVGHFGLGAVVLNAKDGGNVTTTHNFEQGITATKEDAMKYNKFQNNQDSTHWQKIRKEGGYDKPLSKMRKETFKTQEKVYDDYTGKELSKDGRTQIDHIVSAKEIESNPKAHLFLDEEKRAKVATSKENLAWTEGSSNQSKGNLPMSEWLEKTDKKTGQTNAEKYDIDKEKALAKDKEAREHIDTTITKEQFKKQGIELLQTGLKDTQNIAIHSAFGMILVEFVKGISIELKILFKEFGNESLKDIFKRFKQRISKIWADIQSKWKEIIAGSLESAIMAFFSNFLVFVINIFFTTLKSIVRIIRAGFTSLYQAIKIIVNPPKDMPKEDVMFEASKVFVAGLIGAVAMLSSEAIKTWLLSIPGLNAVLILPIPFTSETIGDALSLCVSAAMGAILSTIAIYYMDKYASKEKESRIQIQIMAQSGVVVQYNIAQTWFCLYDAYAYFNKAVQESRQTLQEASTQITQSSKKAQEAINETKSATNELMAFMYEQDMKKNKKS